ncbi:MAG: LysR family transcriptional regulator [Chromatocurvus sp.]
MTGFSSIQNLQHLRALILLYRHGSLRNASLETGISIPTLRRHIDALEADIGARLVARSQSRVEFTAEGRKLLEGALRIERELSEVETTVAAGRQSCSGEVSLSAVSGTGTEWLIPHLARFSQSCPELRIKLNIAKCEFPGNYEDFDLVIQIGKPTDDNRVNRPVAHYSCGFYCSGTVIERYGCPATVEELLTLPHISADWMRSQSAAFEKVFAGQRGLPRAVLHTDHCAAQINAALAGYGWTVIHHRWARKHRNLVRLMPHLNIAESELWISARRGFHKTYRVKCLYDFIVCCFEHDNELFLPLSTPAEGDHAPHAALADAN